MHGSPPSPQAHVTIANMLEPPFCHWAHRYMRRLVPSANVWRGQGSVHELARRPVPLEGIEFENTRGHTTTVDRVITEGFTDGFVVLHVGELVAEH